MIPTYVFGWPTGEETGDFLAVDLGMFPFLPRFPSISPSLPFHSLPIPHFTKSHSLLHLPNSGGTNLRVCLVTLQGDGKFEITQSKYRLTEEQKQEDGQKLFDFCAECLQTFVSTNFEEGGIKEGELLPLGFTVRFSFFVMRGTD